MVSALTLLGPQFRFGDKPVKLQVVHPQDETAVLKELKHCCVPGITYTAVPGMHLYTHRMPIISDEEEMGRYSSSSSSQKGGSMQVKKVARCKKEEVFLSFYELGNRHAVGLLPLEK